MSGQGIPFTTNNAALSLALHTAGVAFMGVWNCYDDDLLRRLNMPSAKAAHEKGLPGKITYFFERTHELQALLDAYDAAAKEFESGALGELEVTQADVVKIACVVLKKRNEFMAQWKKRAPMYLESKGEAEHIKTGAATDNANYPDGSSEGTISHPGFKLISANASEATRRHLGL